MPFLTPKPGWIDWWCYSLSANAGRHNHEIVIYEDDSVEIVLDFITMGIMKHRYHLYGTHEKLSEGSGWLFIDRIQKVTPTPTDEPQDLNIRDFGEALLLDYIRTARTPHLQHPQDMLNMSARWQENFDVLLILPIYVQATIDGLRYMHEEPSDDYDAPDIQSVEEVADVLTRLDKGKFERLERQSL